VLGTGLALALGGTGLPPAGQRMAGVFLAVLVLWATEALPVAVTALLAVLLQPVLGIAGARDTFAAFISPVFFFVLAMFMLARAVGVSGVDRRFALWLLARAGTDPRRVLFALMAGVWTISTVISDLPACAIFTAVAVPILERAGVRPGSAFGRTVMMGIPIAAFIGGVATPAGSSVNILGIHFIQEYGGVQVPFLAWTALGIPMAVVLLPVAWRALLFFDPPEVASVGSVEAIERERRALGPLAPAERKVLALFAVLVTLWIAGTWVKALDVTLVAMAGSLALFLPGVRLLDWREAERGVGWDALIMIGAVTALGAASVQTGLAKWLVDAVLGGMAEWGPLGIVAAVSALTVVVHLAIPIAPVINSALIPPIALLALELGRNPALFALPVAFTASCAFLLPLDAVALVTYPRGYYRMLDMLRPGGVTSLAWVVWMTAVMVLVGPWLGYL
jgi:solute carrier family 13 (sodium-dependent dicarboxylate transporter), member 2/3/5